MPMTPAAQLFQGTGLATNPILSGLMVLSQSMQDQKDIARQEEERKIASERETQRFKMEQEKFSLAKDALKNEQTQREQQLKQEELANRLRKFAFETGATDIPGAVKTGAIQPSYRFDPVGMALGDEGSESFGPAVITDPFTGEEREVSPELIQSILRREEQEQEQKMALPLLQMKSAADRMVWQSRSQAERDELNRKSREKIAQEANATRMAAAAATARKAVGEPAEPFAIEKLASAGMRPTGDLAVDSAFWDGLTGTEKAVLGGTVKPKDVFDRDELNRFMTAAGKSGLVLPNFEPKQVRDYSNQKAAYLQMVDLAKRFVDDAPNVHEGIGSKLTGSLVEKYYRSINHPSIAIYDQMQAFLPGLKELVGDSGVLTNQDVERIGRLMPAFSDTPKQRKMKLDGLINELAKRESAFFGAIPKEQLAYIFATNGIPVASSIPTSGTKPPDLSKLP